MLPDREAAPAERAPARRDRCHGVIMPDHFAAPAGSRLVRIVAKDERADRDLDLEAALRVLKPQIATAPQAPAETVGSF